MPKRQSGNKKNKQSNFAKLSIFQNNKYKFKKSCPLSIKGAPKVDYKNIRLLKKYMKDLLIGNAVIMLKIVIFKNINLKLNYLKKLELVIDAKLHTL